MLLEGEPFSNLLAAEGNLTRTVVNVEDGRWMLGLDFASDTEGTATRGRDGTASFVTIKQSVTSHWWDISELTLRWR
jgi:hypothetical protein